MAKDAPTTDQLRQEIDSGATGEKIGFPDPAAAPLGTDAEAGGSPPTASERKLDAASRPKYRQGPKMPGTALYAIFVAIGAAVVVGATLLGTMG
ncbi:MULTISPECIES: hypothetical protein [unclassified Devosia]|uniref:hypothetical protein n=1 Tax=unclassified Devosia TaxID=196773 RepID=UPI0019D068AB|nr:MULTISPECIES: hypothetical protein [unclassified Devosia]